VRAPADAALLRDQTRYRELATAVSATSADLLVSPTVLARGLDPMFKVRPYGRLIGAVMAELEEQVAEMTAGWLGLIIITPPQLGKSTLVTEWGSMWWLARNPALRIVCASYGDDLALRRGRNVRSLVVEHGHHYELELAYGASGVKEWDLTSGGGMRSVGIGSGLTGFSADRLVIDDPHKDRRDANSLARRDAIHGWWSSTASRRLQPGSIVVIVLTRWHHDDLVGRLLADHGRTEDGGRWRVLHIPGFADPKFGPDPLGREPGGLLPHPKILMADRAGLERHWNDTRRDMLTADFHSMIQGDPQPVEGALATYELLRSIRAYDGHAAAMRTAVAVDPSGGGRSNAGIVAGHLGVDGRLWVTHDASRVCSSAEWPRIACQLAAELDAEAIVLESNFGGDMVTEVIKSAWKILGSEWKAANQARPEGEREPESACPYGPILPRLIRVISKKSKLLRAEPIAQQMELDKVRLGAQMLDLEEQWATWQPDDPDSPGNLDAMVHLAYHLLRVPGAAQVVSTAQTKRDQVSGDPYGGTRITR
jgi:hypothetical protein